MSLLTPPNTSHRSDKEKENNFPDFPVAGPSTRSVVWAPKDTIHSLGTPLKHVSISSKLRPSTYKSILKAPRENEALELPVAVQKRETTPEPSDPLVDLNYLNHPVHKILSNGGDDEASLGQLIEGYNVLAARLRSCISESTNADASWPIFQPLRKNTQAFTNAVVRDVKRALVDPLSYNIEDTAENAHKLPKHALPSPANSPTKKKGGMSEEQVKYARDLCTTCHSVLKLLSAVLSMPAIYNVFEEKQLGEILTAILAIPLADDLPTPNARKSCALAIWVIQVQRLPADVLRPAASRIAYALRRGLDGELGKEGKKGSANDGLKAIHDLCVHLPAVFIPAFTPLLPSVLTNLLAPTLALRTQACHALGGFVNGSVAIPTSTVHTKISNTVAAYLNTASPSPAKVAKSPTKPTEAAIVRTLRTTMNNVEPVHVATGPVWAISVLASFVVLLGSRLSRDHKVNRTVSALLSLGIRHKKSSIRGLTSIAWRPIAWSYIQPPLPVDEDDEDETLESEFNHELNLRLEQARLAHCKTMLSVVDCQAGVSTIAGLLGDSEGELRGSEALRLTIEILQSMTLKAGHTCREGVEALQHMVSGDNEDSDDSERFDMKLLVPSKLFSANPGLLTTDFKNLSTAVRAVLEQLAMVTDIRKLKRSEMALPPVFRGLMGAWCTALGCLEMEDGAELPDDLVEIWSNLLQANVRYIQEKDAGLSAFASSATKYVIHVVEDPKLNLMPPKLTEKSTPVAADVPADSDDTIPECKGNNICTNGELRMRVVQRMWSTMADIFPHDALRECADILLASLIQNENLLIRGTATTTLVEDDEAIERARTAWVSLCVDVLLVCDADAMKIFWGCEEDMTAAIAAGRRSPSWSRDWTNMVWKTFVERWSEVGGDWEGGVVLLGVPFTDRHTWGLGSEDYTLWEQVFQHTTSKALDHGLDTYVVLDNVASFVSSFQTPGASPASSLRLVDLLLSNLDVPDMRELPTNIIELASETMRAMYPPEPRFRHYAMWVVRSLTTVIEHCPRDFSLQLLQSIQEGLCLWLADQSGEWTETEFTYDVIPLYQHIILKVQDLPESVDTLDATAPILDSIFLHRVPVPAVESFTEFWNLAYARHAPPAEGWTGPIRHCLGVVGIMPLEEVIQEVTFPLAPAFVAQPSSPRTPVSANFSTPPTAIKREALSRVQSPQRPTKVYGTFPIVPSTPPSPVNRRHSRTSSIRRTPLSAIQVCQASPKRRRLMAGDENGTDDKENGASIVDIPSVADRIAGLSIPNTKKRHFEEDDEDEEKAEEKPAPMSAKLKGKMRARSRPAKKARIPSPAPSFSSNESEDERWVEEALKTALPFPPLPETPSEQKEDAVSCRTRGKRALQTTAAKPSLQTPTKKVHMLSLDNALHTPMRKLDLTKMSLRRSTSIPEALLKSSEASVSGAKRKWAASTEGDAEGAVASVRIGPPRHAKKRSYYSFSSSDGPEQQQRQGVQSSDDDPHYGQVTPHHLISPAMPRRAVSFSGRLSSSILTRKRGSVAMQEPFGADGQEEESLPGSDDSVATSESGSEESPTKEFVTRQLRRTSSMESISKAKFVALV